MKRILVALAMLGLVILSFVLVFRSFDRHISDNIKPSPYSVMTNTVIQTTEEPSPALGVTVLDVGGSVSVQPISKDSKMPVAPKNPHLK